MIKLTKYEKKLILITLQHEIDMFYIEYNEEKRMTIEELKKLKNKIEKIEVE